MNKVAWRWFRGIAVGVVSVALLALTWIYSRHEPLLHEPNSRWIPLAMSHHGTVLAAADGSDRTKWTAFGPGGPIHLMDTSDLAETGLPIETPTFDTGIGPIHPPLKAVEFSSQGNHLAVLQTHLDLQQPDMFELHLFRLPSGKVVQSFYFPCRKSMCHRIARHLFSDDGRLMAWHEYGRNTVRVWDVVNCGASRGRSQAMVETSKCSLNTCVP